MRRSVRVRLIAVLAFVLTFAVGGGAWAQWSAEAQLAGPAQAARTGVTQTVHAGSSTQTPLTTTYTSLSRTAAGAVSVTNTGSREAGYSLDVLASSATADGLPGAVSVAIAVISDPADCTTDADLASPVTGTLSTSTPLQATGTVEAGATVVLCVRTSMTAADAATYSDESVQIAVDSTLSYADGAAWQAAAEAAGFTQKVGTSALFDADSSLRYYAHNKDLCIQRYQLGDGSDGLGRAADCSDWEGEWRISQNSDGTFYIAWAYNDPNTPAAPRWTARTDGQVLRLSTAADVDTQRWSIIAVSDTEYRIESIAYPGQCIAIGDGLWTSGADPRKVVLADCDDVESQRFTFEVVGDPVDEAEAMTCGGSPPWSVALSFSQNAGYQGETTYRAFLAPESSPETRTAFPVGALGGWYTTLQIDNSSSALKDYVASANGGLGNTWVYVEQQIANSGKWSPVAVGKIALTTSSNPTLGVVCGWQ
ncbi:RICIN domain-containing protein [Microbacterium marinilacus]|uniref:Ricin B lectin domain-containing protein n=1 Tax=Microbacterium marinilacus TaxID=415209 RepID=A0ABP7BJ75_9MICO|nr:RICIN domain-containing protein [Microbacterium marinilacus]MBY0689693.1 RICIN domain-containing protein [Microbacterium marinilacus]